MSDHHPEPSNHESDGKTEPSTPADVGTDDPRVIRSVAVTVEDVIAALEANQSADRGAVLRITPPFAERARARIHVAGGEGQYEGETPPIHLDPASLVTTVPTYPTADDTASDYTATGDDSDTGDDDYESHQRRHTDRLETWRNTVRRRFREEIAIDVDSETITVRLLTLG
jgi:hypothetical protein